MAGFTLEEILRATGGQLKVKGSSGAVAPESVHISDVSTDTRTIKDGDLFLALCGEKFDGHDYAQRAVDDGACALVLSKMDQAPENIPVVLVPDTKKALMDIAAYYRIRSGFKVVAVTGSVGKTSTREMIACALSSCEKVYATKNNENNEIGMSKTILSAPEDAKILVLEMGMRLRGEISELTNIAHPDIAVITNIGVAHIERLGSREEILNAKLEILEGLSENGLLVIPYADEMLKKAVEKGRIRKDVRIAYFSTDENNVPEEAFGLAFSGPASFSEGKIRFAANVKFEKEIRCEVALSTIGLHHVGNALAGLLCGVYLGMDAEKLASGVGTFAQIGHREKIVEVNGIRFLDDSYNAGPESMMSAMASVRRLASDTRAFGAIGDMLELGPVSEEKHYEIGQCAAKLKLDGLCVIGDYKECVRDGAKSVDPAFDVICCEDKNEIVSILKEKLQKGDFVLLKASHSFEMYTILEEYASIFKEGGV